LTPNPAAGRWLLKVKKGKGYRVEVEPGDGTMRGCGEWEQ